MFLETIFVVVTTAILWRLIRPYTSLAKREKNKSPNDPVEKEHDGSPVHSIRR